MPIALAVRISCCFPLFFVPVKYNGDLYCDGGLLENLPFQYWDVIDTNIRYRYRIAASLSSLVSSPPPSHPLLIRFCSSLFRSLSLSYFPSPPSSLCYPISLTSLLTISLFSFSIQQQQRY